MKINIRRKNKLIATLIGFGGILISPFICADEVGTVNFKMFLGQVLSRSPVIAEQKVAVQIEGNNLRNEKLRRLPSLSFGGGYSEFNEDYANLSYSMPIYSFGRIGGSIDLAGEKQRLEEVRLLDVENTVAEKSASNYINFGSIVERIGLLNDALKEIKFYKERVQRRVEIGADSNSELFLIESKEMAYQKRIFDSEMEREVAKKQLEIDFGEDIGEIIPPSHSLFELPSRDKLKTLVMNQNTKILLADQSITIARREEGVAKLNYFPELTLSGNTRMNDSLNTPGDIGIKLNYQLENLGLQNFNQNQKYSLLTEKSEYSADSIELEIAGEYSNLIIEYDALETNILRQNELVDILNETKESFSRQFNMGMRSLVELLGAFREYTDARLEKASMRFQQEQLAIRIFSLASIIVSANRQGDFENQILSYDFISE